jgi:fibronectin-binding autotransporter adhesin
MKLILRWTLKAILAALVIPQFASANTAVWIGNPNITTTTNWSDNANWSNSGGGVPGAATNDLKFNGVGSTGSAGTITSVADTAQHPFSIQFSNNTLAGIPEFHTVLVPSGVTITNEGPLIIGGVTVNTYRTIVNFTGNGTLLQKTNMTIGNNGASAADVQTLLDLSTLDYFIFDNTSGTINLSSGNRSAGDFRMAAVSNYVSASAINANTASSSSGASGTLTFGAGTNLININTFTAGVGRNSCTVNIAGSGGLRLRGGGGTDADRVTMLLGNHNVTGTGSTASGNLSFNGHPVDMKLNTLTLGTSTAAPTAGNNPGNGTLSFDTGVVDVTNIVMAICNNVVFNSANGNLNVGANATLNIGNGGVSLVNLSGAATNATGNITINGGSVTTANSIIKTTVAGLGNITNVSGSLTLASAKNIGSQTMPLDNFSMTSAKLNVSVVNALPIAFVTTLDLADSLNTNNVAALPSIGGFPSQFPIITYTTFSGGGALNLGSLPGGYSGYISNDFINTVWLVITNGPFVAKSDTWGGAVSRDWDTTSLNWTNVGVATLYNDGDFVSFEDGARTNSVNIIGARTPASLALNNSVLNYTFLGAGSIGGAITLVKAGSASLTLTESGGDNFSGGIAVNAGTLILDNANSAISGGLTVAASATAQIGNNSANGVLPAGTVSVDGTLVFSRSDDLTVASAIGGTGSVVKKSAGKLTMTANNTFIGVTIVTNGTLALAGSGTLSNSTQVAVTGAALDLSGKTVPTTLTSLNVTNANLTVNIPNLQTPLNVTDLVPGGITNLINLSALPPIASYPVTLTLIQAANAINGFNFGVGTLPAGSPSFVGTVSLSGDQLSVRLTLTAGPIGVRPQMFWTGADAPNTNWSDGLNWQLPGAPTSPDNVFFTGTGTAVASALSTPGGGSAALIPDFFNNQVDANFSMASLTYTNLAGTYHNTHLANGRTLTMTNNLTVGVLDTGAATQLEFVTISGSGATVNVSNTAANLQVWLGNQNISSVNNQAQLDMSALDNFNAAVNRLTVGASAINNAINRPSGVLYLARTNVVRAGFQTTTMHAGTTTGNAAIDVADCNSNAGSASSLWLGQVNTFIADTIAVGRQKASGNLRFNTIYANVAPYPTLTLQGFTASRVSDLTIGDGVGNTGGTGLTGNALLGGGYVNGAVDVINVGRSSSGATGAGNTIGVLEFDAGTITANTVNIGLQGTSNTGKIGTGTVNVNTNATIGTNAHLVVSGNLSLATNVNSAATAGTLSINGGFVQAGNIIAGVNGAVSTISLVSGTLIVTGAAGTVSAPITSLNLTDGILQLTADGNAPALVATTISPNGTTTLNIGSIVNVPYHTTIPLIAYTGSDPFTSLSLGTTPPGYTVVLVDNVGSSTIDLEIIPPVVFSSTEKIGTNLVIGVTNGIQGSNYLVLTTTNLELPIAQWTVMVTNQFGPGGGASLTNPIVPGSPKRFYLIKLP